MNDNSGTIIDYLQWRGDITFEERDLNVVDALILSTLTYISYDLVIENGKNEKNWVTISDAYRELKKFDSHYYCAWIMKHEDYLSFFKYAANSSRFGEIKVTDYVEKTDDESAQQFAGMTFLLPGDKAFIAFRGTDQSITGWEEDFNMSFMAETPGQYAATEYVNMVASKFDGRLEIGGHSKGGNFAVWSAVNMEEQHKDKVLHVFNNDGPGFAFDFLKSEKFLDMESKILSFVPEGSLVGVLMNNCDYVVIKSKNTSVFQHDPLSWSVLGRRFIYNVDRTLTGRKMEDAINKVMDKYSNEEKAALTKELFDSLKGKNICSLKDLKSYLPKKITSVLPEFKKMIKSYKDDFGKEKLSQLKEKYDNVFKQ